MLIKENSALNHYIALKGFIPGNCSGAAHCPGEQVWTVVLGVRKHLYALNGGVTLTTPVALGLALNTPLQSPACPPETLCFLSSYLVNSHEKPHNGGLVRLGVSRDGLGNGWHDPIVSG